ncbi:MAG: CPBP family glutamic-type intramembrane protease [Deltaproteobacteria bacterium]|nr:CPBP family glutamic-type intramembrane protease [Deltaproteobacteria bacterium]
MFLSAFLAAQMLHPEQLKLEVQPPPRIGVLLSPSKEGGVLVERVLPGSPARRAGVRKGDRILAIDGQKVESPSQAQKALAGRGAGTRDLLITRGDEEIKIQVEAVAQPFLAGPIDEERCIEAREELEENFRSWTPGTLIGASLGLLLFISIFFAWGAMRKLPARSTALVVLPFFGTLGLGFVVGNVGSIWVCPLLKGHNVRLESIELALTEVLLCASSLLLLWKHRSLQPLLQDDGPVFSLRRTLIQAFAYIALWMPRALFLGMAMTLTLVHKEDVELSPVADVVSGASRSLIDGILVFLAGAVLAPIAEESLFRGILAPYLSQLTDGFTAILITALIFGFFHIGGHGPLFVGPTFLGGILGWARLRSRSLRAPIIIHMVLNSTAIGLALLFGLPV